MDEEDLDALLVQGSNAIWDRGWTNTRWLTNHVGCQLSQAEYVVFPRDAEEAITISTLDMFAEMPARRARAAEVVDDIRGSGFRCIREALARLDELGLEDGRIGLVEVDASLSIPYDDMVKLHDRLPEAEVVPVTESFWELRHVKSDEEVEIIERSAKIGALVMEAVIDRIEPGLPESALWGIVADAMAYQGGELPTMILGCSTNMYDSDDGHQRERPRNRTLREGDFVINEHSPRYPDGSESQIGIPVLLGEPSPLYEELIEQTMAVHETVVDHLRPGNTGGDVIDAVDPIVEAAGYVRSAPLVHGELGGGISGPTVGVESPDGEGLTGRDIEFKENMTLVPEVHLSTPDWSAGVFINATYVIEDGGARCLNDFPVEPVILD
jgi:Xaa-Pro aminopeptidase